MKFIHISDLHIHTLNADNKEVTDTLGFIAKKYPSHKLIVTGDITDDGSEHQYHNAFQLLNPFAGQVFICPGNHDFGASGNFYSHERAVRFDEMLSNPLNQGGTFKGDNTPVVNIVRDGADEVMLIALDSNLETQSPFDFACGEIGQGQLESLATILNTASPGMRRIVFFHHHPFMVNDPFMELKDAKELARVLYGKVDVVLFGHKHEMKEMRNVWGCQYLLASDNSPGKAFAKEITVTQSAVTVQSIAIA